MTAAPPPQPVPAAQPGYAYPGRSPWFIFRLLCLVGAVCEVIAAFYFAAIISGGAGIASAWAVGGVGAFFLAWAVP